LIKLNSTDFSINNETEINLGMTECFNIAFNKNGSIAVVVGFSSKFAIIKFGR
jgi:hypothetical protein